jgi:N-acetylglucosamine-6-phosphate deacetylase
MNKLALKGNVILPDKVLAAGIVAVEGERIVGVYAPDKTIHWKGVSIIDYGEDYLAPGLIDLHLHGAMGRDVIDGSVEGLREVAAHQVRCGVTGFVPTTLAAPLHLILAAIASVKEAARERAGAEILGVYLEAPFLNVKKKGAQNPEFIRPIQAEDLPLLDEATRPLQTIITVAPEVGANMVFIPQLKERGWVVSIGHSEASYEQAMLSFEQGITQATHLYNAMSGFQSREPGVVGAVLDSQKIRAELIADGVHVHPGALRLAVRLKGVENICLITDSVNAAGLGDGHFVVGGLEVVVKDGQARLKDSGTLVGSVLTLNRAVKNIIDWTGVTVSQAIRMASLNPARVLGLSGDLGSIEEGKLANLAVFDEEFNVIETIIRGRSVFRGTLGY